MKKILLAFDGSNFSEGAFEFVRRLNEIQPVMVAGLFMPQVSYVNLWSYAAAAGEGGSVFIPLIEESETELITRNIEHFESLCKKHGIRYSLHKHFFDFGLPQLKKESQFADVLILSGELFYNGAEESNRFDYLRDAVHASNCPVLVVPEQYDFPDNIILSYDGSEASVYAIKQFAYIFPELLNSQALLVYAEDEKDKEFPSRELIMEFVNQHYKKLTFYKLELDPKKYFSTWIRDRKGSLLVSGSFSRSAFSQLFKRSFVADVIIDHQLPVFMAHR